jgi:hypothetical protein
MKLKDPNNVAMVNSQNEIIIGPNGKMRTMEGHAGAFGGEENDIVYIVDSMGIGHPHILKNGEAIKIDLPKKVFGVVIDALDGHWKYDLAKFYDPEEEEFDFSDIERGSLVKLVFPESFGENIPITNHQLAPDGLYVVTPDTDELDDDEDEEPGSYLLPARVFYRYCTINANALARLTEIYGDVEIDDD